MDFDAKAKVEQLSSKFESAIEEFIKQSGYVEGVLDTLIAMMMDTNPEVSMTSDRLIKTFHTIEGVCRQGFIKTFHEITDLCTDLIDELDSVEASNIIESAEHKELTLDLDPIIDETIAILKKKKESSDGN